MEPTILRPMGFDPNRPMKKTRFDYVYVALAIAVALALAAWALFG